MVEESRKTATLTIQSDCIVDVRVFPALRINYVKKAVVDSDIVRLCISDGQSIALINRQSSLPSLLYLFAQVVRPDVCYRLHSRFQFKMVNAGYHLAFTNCHIHCRLSIIIIREMQRGSFLHSTFLTWTVMQLYTTTNQRSELCSTEER